MAVDIINLSANRRRATMDALLGIEVEAEGFAFAVAGRDPEESERPAYRNATLLRKWKIVHDGSLRNNGVEFVSVPLNEDAVVPAVSLLWELFDAGIMVPSVRTGIHIHMNCLRLNTDNLREFYTAYSLVEPLLFAACGAEREENIYCIPYYRAPAEARLVAAFVNNPRAYGILQRSCKYSALFSAPLTSYGTVEFRHAPTWQNVEDMHRWVRIVRAVFATSQWTGVWDKYMAHGYARLVTHIFGDETAAYLFDRIGGPFAAEIMADERGCEDIAALFNAPPTTQAETAPWVTLPPLSMPNAGAPPPTARMFMAQQEDPLVVPRRRFTVPPATRPRNSLDDAADRIQVAYEQLRMMRETTAANVERAAGRPAAARTRTLIIDEMAQPPEPDEWDHPTPVDFPPV